MGQSLGRYGILSLPLLAAVLSLGCQRASYYSASSSPTLSDSQGPGIQLASGTGSGNPFEGGIARYIHVDPQNPCSGTDAGGRALPNEEIDVSGSGSGQIAQLVRSACQELVPPQPLAMSDLHFASDGSGDVTYGGVLFVPAPPASASFVQANSAVGSSSGSVTIPFSSAQAKGDLNVVAIGWFDTSSTVVSVTDTLGNSYSPAGAIVRGTGMSQVIYYASGIQSAAAGANSVTVVFSSSVTASDLSVAEYSGVSASSPLDVVASNSGTGTTFASSGSATISHATDLLFGALLNSTGTAADYVDATMRSETSDHGGVIEDQFVPVAGSYSMPGYINLRTDDRWIMQMVAFKTVGPAQSPGYRFVQANYASPTASFTYSSTALSVPYAKAQSAGDLNVVSVGWDYTTASITSVTDSSGNAYALATPTTQGNGLSQAIYYAKNIVSAPAGANTVTVNFSAQPGAPEIRVLEYSGLSTTSPLDAVNVNTGMVGAGFGTLASSGTITTHYPNELVLISEETICGTAHAALNFTGRINTDAGYANNRIEEMTAFTPGVYGNASIPLVLQGGCATSGGWIIDLVSFH